MMKILMIIKIIIIRPITTIAIAKYCNSKTNSYNDNNLNNN